MGSGIRAYAEEIPRITLFVDEGAQALAPKYPTVAEAAVQRKMV